MATFRSGILRDRGWNLTPYLELESVGGDETDTSAVIKKISSNSIELWDLEGSSDPDKAQVFVIEGKFTFTGSLIGKSINDVMESSFIKGTVSSISAGRYVNGIYGADAVISEINKPMQYVTESMNTEFKLGFFMGDDTFYGNDQPLKENGVATTDTDDVGNVFNGNRFHGMDGNDKIYGGKLNDSLWGDNGNDLLKGYAGNDFLYGGVGNDQLYGDDGNDKLVGGMGKDTLEGGKGNDTLNGGTGDDTYVYAFQGSDTISDSAGVRDVLVLNNIPGIHLLWQGSKLEISEKTNTSNKLTILNANGSGQIEIVKADGNEKYLAADQKGTSKADLIIGLDTKDVINGGSGDDVIIARYGNDNVSGGDGNDEIYGEGDNDTIKGDAGNDTIYGDDGDDYLNGGAGKDTLTGGSGKDYFDFTTALGSANVDTITDFTRGSDKIRLENSVMTKLQGTPGALNKASYWEGAGITKGHDADDRILYDTSSGKLYYDTDGSGSTAAVQIALIGTTSHANLDYTDFTVI